MTTQNGRVLGGIDGVRSRLQSTIVAVFLSCLTLQAQETNVTDPWAPFQFLLGKWSGIGSGHPGEVINGSTSFSFDLGKRIILRKNKAEYPPEAGGTSNVVHEDLMIIYSKPTDSKFHAVYFDNEGHVFNYTVTVLTNPPGLVFDSIGTSDGMRYRLFHKLGEKGTLITEFLIAPPGGDYKMYVRGLLKKDQ